MHAALISEVAELESVVAHWLVTRLEPDGLWRDFTLPPGRSDFWSSAWIGWGLAHVQSHPQVIWALQTVVRALASGARPDGWGYNQRTGCDADTTAWVVRLLAVISPAAAQRALPALLRYVDPFGEAHTFLNPAYGRWSDTHPDVTAMVGLAALDGGATPQVLQRIRRAVIARSARFDQPDGTHGQANGSPLASFWWSSPAYRLGWTLCLLARCGGIPSELRTHSTRWIDSQAGTDLPAFEHALQLLALLALGRVADDVVSWHVCKLLASCRRDHWHGSAALLVPPQRLPDTGGLPLGPHTDSGPMTTSLALAALARWRRATGAVRVAGAQFSPFLSHRQGASS
ncbi:hypothetical protein QN362_04465 [Actimicrobium sp. CCC2.4]|uniref:hypothetical protein n=1 Tax=Actimicrobium sp. CCC2.4 TaxID=3048606 RepID=UPI002AC93BEF|nr:hypothetical protein [Actimicrobium sp. CCC2.4]MEB0134580.1 hypothetical protein [Actimicrobium sp. CCC2.4]WPX34022.1 hypothetical protein RHM62_09545 [Actimicrobium sp. CCC2.4]